MEKNQIKSLITEHSSQLHQLADDILRLQEKIEELTVKRREINGIVAALQYVEQLTPEAAAPEAKAEETSAAS